MMTDVIELDVRRLLCPMPVIRTQARIQQMQPGDELVVTCTDPGVKADIPAWCRIHGHQVISVIEQDDNIVLRIRVGSDA